MLKSRQVICKTCDMKIDADKQAQHDKSNIHMLKIMQHMMNSKSEEFMKAKEGIRIVCPETGESGNTFMVSGLPSEFMDLQIEIHSDDYDVRLRRTIVLGYGDVLNIENIVEEDKDSVTIRRGTSHTLNLHAFVDHPFSQLIPLGLLFSRQGLDRIFIMRLIRVSCEDPAMKVVRPEGPYKEVEPVAQLPDAVKIVKMKMSQARAFSRFVETREKSADNYVPGADDEIEEILIQTESVRTIPLPMYYPPSFLQQIHLNGSLDEMPDATEDFKNFLKDVVECIETGLDPEKPENYGKFFTTLLAFEDIQQETDIRMYDNPQAELIPFEDDGERFELAVEGLEEGRPSLLRFDKIYVRGEGEMIEYEGYIDRIKSKSIEIIMGPEFVEKFYDAAESEFSDEEDDSVRRSEIRYGVRFTVSRKSLRLMYRALLQYADVLERSPIDELVMPRVQWPAEPTCTDLGELKLCNPNIGNNPEQLCAVRNIVLGLHRPCAYVLFGPPGTGKTTTITEAILQVYKNLPESRILIVAPSNSAANVVTEKILNSGAVARSDIFRLCALNSGEHKVTPEIKSISNWKNSAQCFDDVGKEKIMRYRIVASTLSMSGVIVTTGVPRGFFTHIFIDEAGHALEPEALVPIAGLLEVYDGKKVGGSLILSGDHLQLGPIIRSPIARMFGMGKSFLERIMETKPYRRGLNNAYNPMVLTKLVRNFRSHPSILDVPNDLFYDGELEPCGDMDITHSLTDYKKLPGSLPIIFHGVYGRETRELSNPSYFNPEEISVICTYVRDLLSDETKTRNGQPIKQSDIGIIAPYRKQVLKLRLCLKQFGFDQITVGSTEEFQGQERLIMIISTVRSSNNIFNANPGLSLGFLRNPKRFNVAVTRAKALMIIVGDPRVLDRDFCWRTLLRTCNDNRCCLGETSISVKRQYEDIWKSLEALEFNLANNHLRGIKLASNGQISITQVSLEEEPQWRDDE